MKFWRNVSPRGAVSDLLEYWRQPTPYRWQILTLSVGLTFTMLLVLIPESQRMPPEKAQVTWISTFAPDRTDAEIAESNEANEVRQDEIRAEIARREEERRERARALGRATFIDVDALEEQMTRRLAAQEAAQQSARERAAAPAQAPVDPAQP